MSYKERVWFPSHADAIRSIFNTLGEQTRKIDDLRVELQAAVTIISALTIKLEMAGSIDVKSWNAVVDAEASVFDIKAEYADRLVDAEQHCKTAEKTRSFVLHDPAGPGRTRPSLTVIEGDHG